MGTSASEGLLVRFHTLVLQNKAEGNTKKLCKKKKKKKTCTARQSTRNAACETQPELWGKVFSGKVLEL